MIRVLHILPDFGVGGAERVAMHLMLNRNRASFEVAGISLYDRRGTDIEHKLDSAGVQVWYLGKHFGLDLRMLPRINRVIKAFRPDVVHTHLSVLRYVLPTATLQQVPVKVHTLHSLAEREADAPGKFINRIAFKYANVVPVSIAGSVSESVSRVYAMTSCTLIPNGIPTADYVPDLKQRAEARRCLGIDPNVVVFLTVGRLTPAKNQSLFLEAFADMQRAAGSPSRCILVGSGELEQSLIQKAQALGISDRVQFLGNRTDIPQLLAALDVFVLSSSWEGNPLSVMEAMAAGKPIIATAVGGVPELIEDGHSGILVPAEDIEQLTAAMNLLASNPDLRARFGQRSEEIAHRRFGVETMTKAYESLYLHRLGRVSATPSEVCLTHAR